MQRNEQEKDVGLGSPQRWKINVVARLNFSNVSEFLDVLMFVLISVRSKFDGFVYITAVSHTKRFFKHVKKV